MADDLGHIEHVGDLEEPGASAGVAGHGRAGIGRRRRRSRGTVVPTSASAREADVSS
jgi:hypothetical protein